MWQCTDNGSEVVHKGVVIFAPVERVKSEFIAIRYISLLETVSIICLAHHPACSSASHVTTSRMTRNPQSRILDRCSSISASGKGRSMYETFSESKKAVLFGVCDGRSLGSFDEPDSEMPRSCRMRFVRLHTKWVPCWPMWVVINSQACVKQRSVDAKTQR